MIGITSKGDFHNLTNFVDRIRRGVIYSNLDRYGQKGVDALTNATPVDTSETAHSWKYEIIRGKRPGIAWYNTNIVNGTPVVILLQYGHGTGIGGYVKGRDFINPAMRPIFDQIAADVWKEVIK